MEIQINTKQYLNLLLGESYKKKQKTRDEVYEKLIRKCLKDIYQPLGKYGRIQNPEQNCETNEGVIGVFPHLAGVDEWSILNRFDTNWKVRGKLEEIYLSQGNNLSNINKFHEWVENNKMDLFSPNGEYTKILVGLNEETINLGNKNEMFAIEVLEGLGNITEIKRFCSGDIRDTLMGMDISAKKDGKKTIYQVKNFTDVKYIKDFLGKYYQVMSPRFNHTKYKVKNVNVLFFVNVEKGQFIMFDNFKEGIKQPYEGSVRFYFKPEATNIMFGEPKSKGSSNDFNKYRID
jgi:hypothetical protein